MGAIIDGFYNIILQFVIGRFMNIQQFNNKLLIKINVQRVD